MHVHQVLVCCYLHTMRFKQVESVAVLNTETHGCMNIADGWKTYMCILFILKEYKVCSTIQIALIEYHAHEQKVQARARNNCVFS